MNRMYEYLEDHAYISKNKKSNYQFELTRERAECIANKYNSLCEEKDKEIERLNNIINEGIEYIESYINQFNGVYPTADMRYLDLHKLLGILKGSDKE